MKKLIQRLILIWCMALPLAGSSQPLPIASGYLSAHQLVNPAYAGMNESAGFLVSIRREYAGFISAPQSQTLAMHTPVFNEFIGLGLNLSQEWYGKEYRTTIMADYAYEIMLGYRQRLRLGLKTGVVNYQNALSRLQLFPTAIADPVFNGNHSVRHLFNMGAGVFYYEEKFYAGISVPKLIKTRLEENPENYTLQYGVQHFYLSGGYRSELPSGITLQPAIMMWGLPGELLRLDLSLNLLLLEQLWLGVLVRSQSMVSLFGRWHFNDRMQAGYAIEIGLGAFQLQQLGTHEITFGYSFDFYNRGRVANRFF